jgi:hypothetical protein
MAGVRTGWRGLVGMVILGMGLSTTAAAEVATLPANCPGYVAHLRSARACLGRGDRQAAVDELRQAREALDSCARSAATSDAVATSSASPTTS